MGDVPYVRAEIRRKRAWQDAVGWANCAAGDAQPSEIWDWFQDHVDRWPVKESIAMPFYSASFTFDWGG